MSGLFGPKQPASQAPTRLAQIPIQSSVSGKARTVVYGMNRLSGNLIWYGDFTATPTYNSSPSGGKGGNSVRSVSGYNYTASLAIGLCEGPIAGLGNIWVNNGNISTIKITENFTIPTGGGSFTVTQAAHISADLGVAEEVDYSYVNSDYWSDQYGETISDSYTRPFKKVASSPATEQYSISGGTYTFSAADGGQTVQITYSYAVPNTVNSGQPQESLALTLFTGTRPQTPWGYLTTNHVAEALAYAGLAYVASEAMDLGVSATLPNLGYEILGLKPFGGGIPDANPADILADIWEDAVHGFGLDSALLGDLTQWSNYCVANGLFLSPVLEAQQAASQLLQELLETTNAAALWSDGVLKIMPYGDTSVAGNGAVYQPQTAPVYDLTDDDFVASPGSPPIQMSRADLADAYNAVKVEYVDRVNAYNTAIIEEKSDNAINLYGLREDSVRTYHSITGPTVAALAANSILRRNVNIIATYTFTLDWRYSLLEPMDLVTITDSALGLNKTPVRITKITEKADGTLDFEAEEFPWGTATPTAYPKQAAAPYIPQDQVDPGNVNAPLIFESTSRQAGFSGYELNIAVSGASAAWGGAHVWASADGSSYQQIGTVKTPANMGVLTAILASGSDPDSTNTLAVDLSESLGQLVSATDVEADQLQTLCFVDGELVSFGTATLTAAHKYNLTYLRRGALGSAVGSHAIGSSFVRLDSALFQWDMDPSWVGKTIHLKFTSINTYGKMEQPLSAATAYTYAVVGSGPGAVGADGIIISSAIDFAKGYTGTLPLPNNHPDIVISSLTGTQRNLAPDSDMKFPAYWTLSGGAAFSDGNSSRRLGVSDAAGTAFGSPFYLAPGLTYTMSVFAVAGNVTNGFGEMQLVDTSGVLGAFAGLRCDPGAAGRPFITITVPAGLQNVSGNVKLKFSLGADTGTPAGLALFSSPQVEEGSVMTAYRPNFADDATGYLPRAALDAAVMAEGDALTRLTGLVTSILTDDAGLGTTAAWSGVSGTGKPADNADVTAANTSADTSNVNGVPSTTVTANLTSALSTASSALSTANAKASVTVSSSAPASPTTGDIWYNTTASPAAAMVWNGSAWVAADSAAQAQAGSASTAAADASALAGTKAKVTIATSAPSSPATGDIWVNTSTTPQTVETWNGSAWALAADITSQNTAANTSAVGSASASSVSDATTRALAAIAADLTIIDAALNSSAVTQYQADIDALALLNAPAEAGADVTAGKSLDILIDGVLFRRVTDVSGGNQIQTGSVVVGAVNVAASTSTSGAVCNSTTKVLLGSVTVTAGGGYVRLTYFGIGSSDSSGLHMPALYLYRGDDVTGTLLYSGGWPYPGTPAEGFLSVMILDTSPGTGSVTYSVYASGDPAHISNVVGGGALSAENVKV